ncbi:MAG TPA: histidine kinase [Flavisolibacter sp.]|nr:histidine kinase [Flavisolibacter sp.]
MKSVNKYLHLVLWLTLFFLFSVIRLHSNSNIWVNLLVVTQLFCYYPLMFYWQSAFLYPVFYERKQHARYFLYSGVSLLLLALVRMVTDYYFLYASSLKYAFYDITFYHFLFTLVTLLIAALIGVLYRMSVRYQHLRWQQEKTKRQQAEIQLHLLKAQLHPHFLFNNLNNIYSLATNHPERTAVYVSRLSELLRYFVEHSSRPLIPVGDEIGFIENYIGLERLKQPSIQLEERIQDNMPSGKLPPMLLLPLVENCFKHGCLSDPLHPVNISISYEANEVVVETGNKPGKNGKVSTRTGLVNLKERLELLYPGNHVLRTGMKDGIFTAYLKIPVYEA